MRTFSLGTELESLLAVLNILAGKTFWGLSCLNWSVYSQGGQLPADASDCSLIADADAKGNWYSFLLAVKGCLWLLDMPSSDSVFNLLHITERQWQQSGDSGFTTGIELKSQKTYDKCNSSWVYFHHQPVSPVRIRLVLVS